MKGVRRFCYISVFFHSQHRLSFPWTYFLLPPSWFVVLVSVCPTRDFPPGSAVLASLEALYGGLGGWGLPAGEPDWRALGQRIEFSLQNLKSLGLLSWDDQFRHKESRCFVCAVGELGVVVSWLLTVGELTGEGHVDIPVTGLCLLTGLCPLQCPYLDLVWFSSC